MEEISISVKTPGNLLLIGEYFILEEGGLGIAVAPAVFLEASINIRFCSSSNNLPGPTVMKYRGTAGPKVLADFSTQLNPQDNNSLMACFHDLVKSGEGPSYFREVLLVLDKAGFFQQIPGQKALYSGAAVSSIEIIADSSAFHSANGGKRGFGSSAALTVSLTALILSLFIPYNTGPFREKVFSTALAAHRLAQGGGSGYDVAVSTLGGAGIFTGGVAPSFERISSEILPSLYLCRGEIPVVSSGAVTKYYAWRDSVHGNTVWKRLFIDSQRDILKIQEQIFKQSDTVDWSSVFLLGRQRGIAIGTAIDVPAEIQTGLASEDPQAPVKAMGAGNEIGFSWQSAENSTPLRISEEGVTIII